MSGHDAITHHYESGAPLDRLRPALADGIERNCLIPIEIFSRKPGRP
jgi:hypothetical protein